MWMELLWKTVKETPSHSYQEHKWFKRKRRAVPRVPSAGEPFHGAWVAGGEFRKTRAAIASVTGAGLI